MPSAGKRGGRKRQEGQDRMGSPHTSPMATYLPGLAVVVGGEVENLGSDLYRSETTFQDSLG